jgi:uncharacterized membrane protein
VTTHFPLDISNVWNFTSTPTIRLNGIMLSQKASFTMYVYHIVILLICLQILSGLVWPNNKIIQRYFNRPIVIIWCFVLIGLGASSSFS